jgi:hypothetical protein
MDPITLRAVERILAVLIGGLAIVLGYRLFLALPQQRDSSGTIRLPWNVTVMLGRVGPGVFFALFGAAVVGFSLHAAVHIEQGGDRSGARPAVADYRGFAPAAPSESGALASRRLAAQMQVEYLNTLPGLLRGDLREDERKAAWRGLGWAKLAIMEPLWDANWGDLTRFKDWAEGDSTAPPPPGLEDAAAFFTAGRGDDKRRSAERDPGQ